MSQVDPSKSETADIRIGPASTTTERTEVGNQNGPTAKAVSTGGDVGGAEGTRTPDFLRAREALSQLSYSPSHTEQSATRFHQKGAGMLSAGPSALTAG